MSGLLLLPRLRLPGVDVGEDIVAGISTKKAGLNYSNLENDNKPHKILPYTPFEFVYYIIA